MHAIALDFAGSVAWQSRHVFHANHPLVSSTPDEIFFSCRTFECVLFREDFPAMRAGKKKYSTTCQRMALTVVLAGLQSLARVTNSGGGHVDRLIDNVSE